MYFWVFLVKGKAVMEYKKSSIQKFSHLKYLGRRKKTTTNHRELRKLQFSKKRQNYLILTLRNWIQKIASKIQFKPTDVCNIIINGKKVINFLADGFLILYTIAAFTISTVYHVKFCHCSSLVHYFALISHFFYLK